MARKKHHKKTHRRRRSGMAGLGKIDVTNVLTIVAGAVGAKFLNKVIPSTVNPKIVAGGKIALGLALPMISKDGKTKNMLSGVGNGFIAVGALELLTSFGVLNGLGATDSDMLVVSLDGADLPTINGDDLNVINGPDDFNEELGESVLGENVLAGEDENELY